MKLNIVIKAPDKIFVALMEQFPTACVEYTSICPEIHNFEVNEIDDIKVYSLENLIEFANFTGIALHDIRIY